MAATMTESTPVMAAEEPAPYTGGPVEIRFPVHPDEPPWTVVRRDRLEIELVGPGGVLTVELPAEVALDWTGALVAAIPRLTLALSTATVCELRRPPWMHRSRAAPELPELHPHPPTAAGSPT